MCIRKKLSRKQLAVIEDLLKSDLDEENILIKHNVSRNVYNNWVSNELFETALKKRIKAAGLVGKALAARYSLFALAKLVQLTESEKEETARRACLDIIELPHQDTTKDQSGKTDGEKEKLPELSDEKASRILAVLAEDSDGG